MMFEQEEKNPWIITYRKSNFVLDFWKILKMENLS